MSELTFEEWKEFYRLLERFPTSGLEQSYCASLDDMFYLVRGRLMEHGIFNFDLLSEAPSMQDRLEAAEQRIQELQDRIEDYRRQEPQ